MLKSVFSSQSGGGVLGGFVNEVAGLLELNEIFDDPEAAESAESGVWLLLDPSCEFGACSLGGWVAKVRLVRRMGRT